MEDSAFGVIGLGFENKDIKEVIATYEEMLEGIEKQKVEDTDLSHLIALIQLQSLYKKTIDLLKRLDAIDTAEKENAREGEG